MIFIEGKSNNKDKITKTRDFLQEIIKELGSSKKLIEMAKEAMKKQLNKKRQNPQKLKQEDKI